MDTTQIANLAVLALFAGFLILLGVFALRLIDRIKPNNPVQADILHALREFAKEAYAAGINLALSANQQEQTALTSADIKAIADKYYAILPDTITILGIVRPIAWIKVFVTQVEWESLVESVANEIEARLARNATWLQAQLNAVQATRPMPPRIQLTNIQQTLDSARG